MIKNVETDRPPSEIPSFSTKEIGKSEQISAELLHTRNLTQSAQRWDLPVFCLIGHHLEFLKMFFAELYAKSSSQGGFRT